MNDPLIARFADACGATGPLDLRIDLAGGSALAEGSVHQPFTLIGRDDACDVTLSDPDINLRHAWLQVVGGRAFAVDLGSRTGLLWPGGKRGSGWLDVNAPVRVGPFVLRLRAAAGERPSDFPAGYNPLAADSGLRGRPPLTLEFRNGRRGKDRWTVNRLLTLIGRAPECKIHLTADDIAAYHCGLVATRDGLWVVDLSGRGVVVNGERMRVSPLGHGSELWVGRFLIGCHGQGANGSPSGRHPRPPLPPAARPVRKSPGAPNGSSAQPPEPEDEVELGNDLDPSGLPASHIMADMFRMENGPGASGQLSHPIQVSGGPPPSPPGSGAADLFESLNAPAPLGPTVAPSEASVVPLLCQLADVHSRMDDEFHRSQRLLGQLFARVRREHVPVLYHELLRIQELTAELNVLQAEVARQTLEHGATDRATTDEPPATPPPDAPRTAAPAGANGAPAEAPAPAEDPAEALALTGSTPLSVPTPLPASLTPIPDAPGPHPIDRLNALLHERAVRWQGVIALFTGV